MLASHTPTARLARRPISTDLLATLGPLALWAGTILALLPFLSGDVPDGQCEGIGWGCTLSARDGLALIGLYGGVVIVPVATGITVLTALIARPAVRRSVVVSLLGAYAVILGILALLFLAG